MFRTRVDEVVPDIEPGKKIWWLLHESAGPKANGVVAITESDPGFQNGRRRHPQAEQFMVVLEGGGAVQAGGKDHVLAPGAVMFVPRGACYDLNAGAQGMRMLHIYGGVTSTADAAADQHVAHMAADYANAKVTEAQDVAMQTFNDPEKGLYNMQATFHVNNQNVQSEFMAIGQSIFNDPRSSRPMHFHTHAPEFLYVLEGEGKHVTETGQEIVISKGDVYITGVGEPHGFKFEGPKPAEFIFGFLGAKNFEDAGTELVQH